MHVLGAELETGAAVRENDLFLFYGVRRINFRRIYRTHISGDIVDRL